MYACFQEDECSTEKCVYTPARIKPTYVQEQPNGHCGYEKLGKIPEDHLFRLEQVSFRYPLPRIASFQHTEALGMVVVEPGPPIIHQPVRGVDYQPQYRYRRGALEKRAVDKVGEGYVQRNHGLVRMSDNNEHRGLLQGRTKTCGASALKRKQGGSPHVLGTLKPSGFDAILFRGSPCFLWG